VILFLFGFTYSKDWYIIVSPSEQNDLFSSGCYHGSFGPISLLSCPHPTATFLKTIPDELSLCVIQTADSNLAILTAVDDAVLYQIGEYYLFIPTSLSDCEEDQVLTFARKVFPSPLIPVSPHQKYINVTGMDPDPVIVEVLKQVNGENMMNYIVDLASFYTRHSRAFGSVQASEYLVNQYTDYGLETSTFFFQTNFSDVVIAESTGTSYPDEVIVVGAHYDSRAQRFVPNERAPGANDNASGNSVLLELARLISEFGLKFERTIRLIAFSGEEQGLVGSRQYANYLRSNDVNVQAMFNADMLGWKPSGSAVSLGMKRDNVDLPLLQSVNEITRLYVPDLGIGVSPSCCSDYISFYEVGYPAVGYFQFPGSAANYPYYHSTNDLPQHIDQDFLEIEAKALIAAALTYAGVYQ